MKIKIKVLLILLFLAVFFSCREDEYRLKETSEEQPLVKESAVASLMKRTSLKDGSIDNIIDQANCITIKLPVTIEVNGISIIVSDTEDYNTIEAIFDEYDDDTDTLIISYPITIILEDFTEKVITSDAEFNTFKNDCLGEDEEDDDIECIDFNYPIAFTTYNTLIDKLGSKSINSDKELYEFIDSIEDYLIVNINFPLVVTLSDGTSITIDNLDTLKFNIENAKDDCDEDDNFDYNDDDNLSGTEQEFIDLLKLCPWEIDELEVSGQHVENQFEGYKFLFNENGVATATNTSGISYNGTWEVTTNSGLRLTIQFDDLSSINNTWRLHEIHYEDDGTELDLRNLEDHMKLEQKCP